MLKGQIVKIISNLFTVETNHGIYDCQARGKLRLLNTIPLVGDYCTINEQEKCILEIEKRKNELNRPKIANIDVALIVASAINPDVKLLDKLLSIIIINQIKPVICFTKLDLLTDKKEIEELKNYYNQIGIKTFFNTELAELKLYLQDKLIVLTGQTGAGKSTLLNKLKPELKLKTNPVSKKLGRGIHTTRHVQIYVIDDIKIADTPGFSALELTQFTKEQIKMSFVEFLSSNCQFRDCNHLNEKKCGVKKAVENNKILPSRYENYKTFFSEGQ